MALGQQRRILLGALTAVVVIGGTALVSVLIRPGAVATPASARAADPVERCVVRVVTGLRASITVGPERAQDVLVRLYGTESVEYEAFLAALTQHGFPETALAHGLDPATETITPAVRTDCAAATSTSDPAPVTSADPCTAAVLAVLDRIVTSGDYTGGSDGLIRDYGLQSAQFSAYAQLQGRFVETLTRAGGNAALREALPDIEAICAGGTPGSDPPAGAPAGDCVTLMAGLLRDVVEGRTSQDDAESRAPDGTGRERLRAAIEGTARYRSDGLSREDAITQAADAFTTYCPR